MQNALLCQTYVRLRRMHREDNMVSCSQPLMMLCLVSGDEKLMIGLTQLEGIPTRV